MLSVKISLASHIGHRTRFVELVETSSAVEISFDDGAHTFQSEDIDIGTFTAFGNRRLVGRLVFDYVYDEARHTVTVCGTDFASADGCRLVTFPAGTEEYCHHRAARSAGFVADDLMANPHWNCRTPVTTGVDEVLSGLARTANEALIAALKDLPGVVVQVRTAPPEVSPDDYRQLLVVYRDGVFHGLYEPGTELGPQDEVVTIESVWGGTVHFSLREAFANVIGSTNDPHIAGKTWINLWADQFGVYPNICTSYRFNGFNCGTSFVGGHIITGTVARSMPRGSDSVYIMPICRPHNNDDNVYMEALQYLDGIWLKNYLGGP
ncbi:hypothetical protein [Actinophytocola sp. NPDC049390]|uniref:hypothetical protein n=1 Tax=Actinophytocola sp. NPDC049390 TaxID=3363894 RepID=UPI0037872FAB